MAKSKALLFFINKRPKKKPSSSLKSVMYFDLKNEPWKEMLKKDGKWSPIICITFYLKS